MECAQKSAPQHWGDHKVKCVKFNSKWMIQETAASRSPASVPVMSERVIGRLKLKIDQVWVSFTSWTITSSGQRSRLLTANELGNCSKRDTFHLFLIPPLSFARNLRWFRHMRASASKNNTSQMPRHGQENKATWQIMSQTTLIESQLKQRVLWTVPSTGRKNKKEKHRSL